jgi:elongation factor P
VIAAGDLRLGTTVDFEGDVHEVLEYQHIKLARGGATVKVKLRNLRTFASFERTFRPEDRFNEVRLERTPMQFLYRDGDQVVLMNQETYEQLTLDSSHSAEALKWLKEGDRLFVMMHDGRVMDIEVPITADLKVARTDPGERGDTAAGASKPATLETGVVIQVPLFVDEGERIRVDTRSGRYIERVK